MLKIEHLVPITVPTGNAVDSERLIQARSLQAILQDTSLPENIQKQVQESANSLTRIAGMDAVIQTAKGKVVKDPTEQEWALMDSESKVEWAVAAAMRSCGVTPTNILRDVTDRLGAFAIIPYSALSDLAFDGEEDKVKTSVDNFAKWAIRSHMDAWVVAPINYYDVAKHAMAGGIGVPYGGSEVSMIMHTLQLNLPLHVSTVARVGNLETRVDDLDRRVTRVEKRVSEHDKDIQQLKVMSDQQQKSLAAIKADLDQKTLRLANAEQQLALANRQQVFNQDPLIFAVPKDTDIRSSDTKAVLGPCWGPEIDQIVAELRNLVSVSGERQTGSVDLWAKVQV